MARIPKNKKEAEDFVNRALLEWRLALLLNEKGNAKTCLANALIAFRQAPEWAGILQFDTFHQRAMLAGIVPWSDRHEERAWTPTDDGFAANWLQHEGIMLASKMVSEAIELVSRDKPFHPVLAHLERLTWDGEPRLDEWAIDYLGAEDTSFVRAISSRWLISAIARVMQPGCKADCALILEGRQGIGKSQALKILFSPWFTDELAELGSKDAAIQLAGVWCVELAELVGMRRGDLDRIKAFMSRTHDRYRPPYGMRAIDQGRQCVFAGTVNDGEYLRDESGGRRWWPILCQSINLDGLREARDQILAEARTRYEAGEIWWLDGDDLNIAAGEQQDTRRQRDPWEDLVSEFVNGRLSVAVNEVLDEAFSIPKGDRSQLHANRVAACLKAIGWVRYQQRLGDKRIWLYRPEVDFIGGRRVR